MTAREKVKMPGFWIIVILMVLVLTSLGSSVSRVRADEDPPIASGNTSTEYMTVNTFISEAGAHLTETIIHGPPVPPPGFEAQQASVTEFPATAKILTVPTYNWV
ncbi:MAG: hypothetical protein ABIJ65_09655, partial [Chloroflexota bacterium]